MGDFMWTGVDYYGETGWHNRGHCLGYLDLCGFKKDGFYFFKSIWTQQPTIQSYSGIRQHHAQHRCPALLRCKHSPVGKCPLAVYALDRYFVGQCQANRDNRHRMRVTEYS